MLSQFKYNLKQAIQCLFLHKQDLINICADSVDPLSQELRRILPNKLFTVFAGILNSGSYKSISEFFNNLQQLQKDVTDQPIQTNGQESSRISVTSGNNSFIGSHNKFLIKRGHNLRKIASKLPSISYSQINIMKQNPVDQKQLIDTIFHSYKKVDEGSKRVKSFQEKELFRNTLNYHKIVRFLQDLEVKISPDSRLKLLILIKKNSDQSNFINKNEFQQMYPLIKNMIQITPHMQNNFYAKREQQILTRKRLFSRKLQTRSINKVQKQRRLSHITTSQKVPLKVSVQKLNNDKSFHPKSVPETNCRNPEKFLSQSRLQKTAIQNKLQKMKIHFLNWQNLKKIKQQNNVLKSILKPDLDLEMDSDEDQEYLRQYYKTNGIQNQAKRIKQSNSIIVPDSFNKVKIFTELKASQ